jgi:phosphopantothenoylcysteine decarboxylase/phosphopantothenate--cysteine ligase
MKILITAGPTREYLDDVRFLSNASSGKMGYALAQAALDAQHAVVLVSGPVALLAPPGCEFHAVETTDEMREACLALYPNCNGIIATAAVCDYRPRQRLSGKIAKTGKPLFVELVETPDILGELGRRKGNDRPWIVGFALEAQNARENALRKLKAKGCDAIVLNHPQSIGSDASRAELIDRTGATVATWDAGKTEIAHALIAWIEANLGRSGHPS